MSATSATSATPATSAGPAVSQAGSAPRTAEQSRYVLRLADTSLVLGQRLGEWVGHAPALEEELALANLALDLIGQAAAAHLRR